jgi:hypothetical protein
MEAVRIEACKGKWIFLEYDNECNFVQCINYSLLASRYLKPHHRDNKQTMSVLDVPDTLSF